MLQQLAPRPEAYDGYFEPEVWSLPGSSAVRGADSTQQRAHIKVLFLRWLLRDESPEGPVAYLVTQGLRAEESAFDRWFEVFEAADPRRRILV